METPLSKPVYSISLHSSSHLELKGDRKQMSKLALTYRKCANDSSCMLHLVGLSLFILKHFLALGLSFSGCSLFGLLLPIRSNNKKGVNLWCVLYFCQTSSLVDDASATDCCTQNGSIHKSVFVTLKTETFNQQKQHQVKHMLCVSGFGIPFLWPGPVVLLYSRSLSQDSSLSTTLFLPFTLHFWNHQRLGQSKLTVLRKLLVRWLRLHACMAFILIITVFSWWFSCWRLRSCSARARFTRKSSSGQTH